eukprot:scaffold5887_cov108-Isochrysis_galbana.AAC.4
MHRRPAAVVSHPHTMRCAAVATSQHEPLCEGANDYRVPGTRRYGSLKINIAANRGRADTSRDPHRPNDNRGRVRLEHRRFSGQLGGAVHVEGRHGVALRVRADLAPGPARPHPAVEDVVSGVPDDLGAGGGGGSGQDGRAGAVHLVGLLGLPFAAVDPRETGADAHHSSGADCGWVCGEPAAPSHRHRGGGSSQGWRCSLPHPTSLRLRWRSVTSRTSHCGKPAPTRAPSMNRPERAPAPRRSPPAAGLGVGRQAGRRSRGSSSAGRGKKGGKGKGAGAGEQGKVGRRRAHHLHELGGELRVERRLFQVKIDGARHGRRTKGADAVGGAEGLQKRTTHLRAGRQGRSGMGRRHVRVQRRGAARHRTCPEAPTMSTRPRGTAVASLGLYTARVGAATSLGDMTGETPSGTGHRMPNRGSNGWVSACAGDERGVGARKDAGDGDGAYTGQPACGMRRARARYGGARGWAQSAAGEQNGAWRERVHAAPRWPG